MLNIGIIGLGIGESHLLSYLNHDSCNVKTVCDFNPEVREAFRLKYPDIPICSDSDEILEDPDIQAVSITSYDHLHYDQIIKGLTHQKHLFVEKPLVTEKKHADQIKRLLEANKSLILSSNLILRKTERFSDLRNRILRGEFGDIGFINAGYHYGRLKKITDGWRSKIENYSVVLGGGIHLIDLILWMTNQKPVSVFARGNNLLSTEFKYPNNDLNSAMLMFNNGLIVQLVSNFANVSPHFHQFEVYGQKQTFINGVENAHIYTDRDVKNGNYHYLVDKPVFEKYKGYQEIKTSYKNYGKGDFIDNFVDSIINKVQPEVTQNQIFDALSVAFAIDESVRKRKEVKIKYL